jgi:transposase
MLYIGLDVHQRTSTLCVLDEQGREVNIRTIKGHPRRVVEFLGETKGPFAICFEASSGYGWLYEQLKPLAARVAVAHPGQVRLIFRCKRKNDRVDARKLAKLLFLDEVPTVYVPSLATRAWRGLVEHRHRCIVGRTRGKNGIRSLLRMHGIEAQRGLGLWSQKGVDWLQALEFPTEVAALQRDQLVDDLHFHNRKIKRANAMLRRLADQQPGIVLLRTVPGVGIRTAEAFLAYVDDPKRFQRTKAIGRYFGLIPSQDASASMNRLGRITKEGPGTVRKVLVEAAWQGIRRSPTIRAYFERIRQERDDRKKKALVATAHYLARVLLGMLRTGECWREDATLPATDVA